MAGETNLSKLIRDMQPTLNPGEYVFATVDTTDGVDRTDVLGEFKEKEGTTLIIARQRADALKLSYGHVAAWITLEVHSALEATGLTAAFSTALAQHQISCNVVAGYHHDHLFVPYDDRDRAINVLKNLSAGKTTRTS